MYINTQQAEQTLSDSAGQANTQHTGAMAIGHNKINPLAEDNTGASGSWLQKMSSNNLR